MKKLLTCLVALPLVFNGCGGGGGADTGSSKSNTRTKNGYQHKGSEEKKVRLFNSRMLEYSNHTSKINTQIVSILKDASNNFNTDLENMSYKDAMKVMDEVETLSGMLDEDLLLKYELSNILSSSSILQRNLTRSIKKPVEERLVFIAGVGFVVAGVGYALKTTIFDGGRQAHEDRNKITEQVISALSPRDFKRFHKEARLGLPDDATSAHFLAAYRQLSFNDRNIISSRMMAFATEGLADENSDLDPDFALAYKENSVKTAINLGKAAVVAEANLITTVLGGQGVDKIAGWLAKNIGLSEAGQAIVAGTSDMLVSVSGNQPLDYIGNMVTGSTSKKKNKIKIKKSKMDLEKAKKTLKDDDASLENKEKARNKLREEIARKTKIITKEDASQIEIEVPKKTSLQTTKNVRNSGKVKVGDTGGDSTILILSEKIIPEIKKNISVIADPILEIGGTLVETLSKSEPETKPSQNDQDLDLIKVSYVKISEDALSIDYKVVARATNLKENATATISITNAAVSNRTKTLRKGGSVSWVVSVAEKDATCSISVKGQVYDARLKGLGTKGRKDTDPGFSIADYRSIADVIWEANFDLSGCYLAKTKTLALKRMIYTKEMPKSSVITLAEVDEIGKKGLGNYTSGFYDVEEDKMREMVFMGEDTFFKPILGVFSPTISFSGTATSGKWNIIFKEEIKCRGTYVATYKKAE